MCLCTVVPAEQNLVVQSFVFAKTVLHTGMKKKQRLLKVAFV